MAIAFDVGTDGNANASNVQSITWSHTCTGANGYLVVAATCTTSNSTLQATYNTVAMALIDSFHDGASWTNWIYLFGLAAPATGAHSVVVSTVDSSSVGLAGVSASYTGVHQTVPYGTPAHFADGSSGYSSPLTGNLSSATDELVINAVAWNYGDEDPTATGTGQIIRGTKISTSIGTGSGGVTVADLPGAATTTASYTFSVHANEYPSWTIVALKPATGGGATNNSMWSFS